MEKNNSDYQKFNKVSNLVQRVFKSNLQSVKPLFIEVYEKPLDVFSTCVIFRCSSKRKDVLADGFLDSSEKILEVFNESYFKKSEEFVLEYKKKFNEDISLIKKY